MSVVVGLGSDGLGSNLTAAPIPSAVERTAVGNISAPMSQMREATRAEVKRAVRAEQRVTLSSLPFANCRASSNHSPKGEARLVGGGRAASLAKWRSRVWKHTTCKTMREDAQMNKDAERVCVRPLFSATNPKMM